MFSARDAQSYTLGMGQGIGATVTLSGTAQQPSLLQDLTLACDLAAGTGPSGGLVTGIRCAGQRIDVTNQGIDINAFSATSQMEGQRSVGISIEQQQTFAVDVTPTNATDLVSASVGVDSMLGMGPIIPINELGFALNYAGGLGSTTINAGAAGVLTCTILRPCTIGRVGLTIVPGAGATLFDVARLQVRSVTLNNLEYLAGASGVGTPIDSVQASTYAWTATDRDGLTLGVDASTNDVLTISFNNTGANPVVVSGGFFCLPTIPGTGIAP